MDQQAKLSEFLKLKTRQGLRKLVRGGGRDDRGTSDDIDSNSSSSTSSDHEESVFTEDSSDNEDDSSNNDSVVLSLDTRAMRKRLLNRRRARALQLLRYLQETRYLKSRTVGISKSGAWYQDVVNRLPLNVFRHYFRMNPDSFLFILSKIREHAVFKNNA